MSELGGCITTPAQAPAGTKRLSNRLLNDLELSCAGCSGGPPRTQTVADQSYPSTRRAVGVSLNEWLGRLGLWTGATAPHCTTAPLSQTGNQFYKRYKVPSEFDVLR